MTTQGGSSPAPCKHAAAAAKNAQAAAVPDGVPRLMRVSEVERECEPDSVRAQLLKWVREFIGAPHPELGRSGSICPFVPGALNMDTIWFAEVTEAEPTAESIGRIIKEYRNVFLATEPSKAPESINKAFLVAFPTLAARGAEGTALVDEVQYQLKPYFVDQGMMLGEFHSMNESPGLRNPEFRPLRSPVPMLAIRLMVESDLPFMTRDQYSPQERAAFLRSYLYRLGGSLKPVKFNDALEKLIVAEVSMRAPAPQARSAQARDEAAEPA
ncbi:hypothetical protein J5226_03895 [Lysobacter sp. K5869]|uniref:DUF6875 domain-containing protein n=1 Tax=Lysobacter sp. K5869 TaxID=2820808 RepID=UPI001C06251D|nr:hypothetical protein [Lysobacter sp. K5869]QWP77560.1 hypothetical protein J5226_03895 [Lysobacter sp. K5869]